MAAGCGGPNSSLSAGGTGDAPSQPSAETGAGSAEPAGSAGSTGSAAPGEPAKAAQGNAPPSSPGARPKGLLSRKEAEQYVLDRVNSDRKKHGLPPVVWDEIAADGGQRHADDMAAHGFTAHIGTDGSPPELRYSEAGGTGMVMENVGCFADTLDRELDPDPRFPIEELERIQRTFMDEVPPFDGHKRNILTPQHTGLGVALAMTKGLPIVCMAQEFVDNYAKLDPLPRSAKVKSSIKVSGSMRDPAVIAGVGIARVDKPRPAKPATLLKTRVYAIPQPYATYFPKGFKTKIPVQVSGNSFTIEVPLDDRGKPGLYGVSVWAKLPDVKELVMVSLRTIMVD